jgi:hypothetical protein
MRLLTGSLALLAITLSASAQVPSGVENIKEQAKKAVEQAKQKADDAAKSEPAKGSSEASEKKKNERLETLIKYMAGSFNTGEQSSANKEYRHIVLHMTPIWTDRTDAKWLYVEQAMAAAQDKPYRQRVYRVTALDEHTFKSEVFELPGSREDVLAFAGAWANTEKLKGVSPDTLKARPGCALTLRHFIVTKPAGEGEKPAITHVFEGETKGQECTSNLPNVKYIHSQARITEKGLVAWDRGYAVMPDGTEILAMGPDDGGYRFMKEGTAPAGDKKEEPKPAPATK